MIIKNFMKKSKAFLLIILCLFCVSKNNANSQTKLLPPIPKINEKPIGEIIIGDFVGKWWNPIPKKIRSLIYGRSYKEGCVPIEDLCYIQITHINTDGKILQGELVYHINLAREITEIFLDLFKARYPIEKVRLIDHYKANDDLAMFNNCSSALCVRPITGCSNRYSKHSYGGTIDINPITNPYVKGKTVLPPTSSEFLDRTREDVPTMIKEGDLCYQAFVKRGYTWGGNWTSLKDYQHFEKDPALFIEK
jgi:hypothetical protein